MATGKQFNAENGISVGTSLTTVIDASRNITAGTLSATATTITGVLTQSGGQFAVNHASASGQPSFKNTADSKVLLIEKSESFVKAFSSGGAIATNTVVVANTTSLTKGMAVSGTGIAAGAYVTDIVSTTVTVSANHTSQVSGNLTFTSRPMYIGSSSEFPFQILGGNAGATTLLALDHLGSYGIGGTPSASEKFYVNGNMKVENDLTVNGTLITAANHTITANSIFGTNSGNTAVFNATVDINAGTLDGVTIGANARGAANFTTIDANGNVTLGDAGTDTVRINGTLGVGNAAVTNVGVYVRPTALTGTLQYSLLSDFTATSAATSSGTAIFGRVNTAAATFTMANAYTIHAADAVKGTNSIITNLYGVYVADQTAGVSNFGIRTLVSSGANKWNLYASGTAPNYFAGEVLIGSASDDGAYNLQVTGTSLFKGAGAASLLWGDTGYIGALTFSGSDAIIRSNTGAALRFEVNASTEAARITSAGNVLVATTTDNTTHKLQVNGGAFFNAGETDTVRISRNATQYIDITGSAAPSIISYSAPTNAKPLILNTTTDAVNTTLSSGSLGYAFKVYSADVLRILDTSSTFYKPLNILTNDAAAAFRITQTGAGYALLIEDSASTDTTPFVVDSGGTVLIGTTTSDGVNKLQVDGGVLLTSTNKINFFNTNYYIRASTGLELKTNDHIRFLGAGDAERARFATTTGNLLLGTTTDNSLGKLQVSGSATISNNLYMTGGVSGEAYRVIVMPGQTPYTGASSVTGALTVTLPVGMTNNMIRMVIRVYEYTTNESFEVHCGGYTNTTGTTWANNPFAYIVGNPNIDRQFNVRFGYTAGGKAVVYIGETGSTWSFPNFYVSECYIGHTNASSASMVSGWVCSASVAFENVTATVSASQVGYQAVAGNINTLIKRGATRGNAQVTGYSTSWGTTGGVDTGGVNVVMGAASSATWLISGTSGGTFRGGIQLLDTGTGAMRFFTTATTSNYFGIDSNGSLYTDGNLGLYSGGTGTVGIDSNSTGTINIGTNANSKNIVIGNDTGTTKLEFKTGTGAVTLKSTTAVTNAPPAILYLIHETTGVPANGIGSAIAFGAETSANNVEFGALIEAVSTDTVAATENFDLVVKLMTNGAGAAEKFRFKDDGGLQLSGSGNSIIRGASAFTYTLPAATTNPTIAVMKTAGSTDVGAVWYNGTAALAGAFYGGVTAPVGTNRLNYSGYFHPTYINLSASGDTATAASHYFVETATDGYVTPKTLANVRTEIIQGAASTAGLFDVTATNPTSMNRLNYNGYLYATRFTHDGVSRFDQNSLVVRGGSPTVYFRDTDANSAMIHCNANLLYILRGANDTETWTQVGGQWPCVWDLTNNNMTAGGAITAIGDITAFSDARLKTNVLTISDALNKVNMLRGVSYTRIDTNVDSIGVIAQEVQAVIPEVVTSHKNPDNGEETLTVAYGNMVGVLIEAIKELTSQVNVMKTEIEELRRK